LIRIDFHRSSSSPPSLPDEKSDFQTNAKARRKKFKEMLRENIYTVPNFLSATRLVLSPYIAYQIYHDNFTVALGAFIVAGVTDLLDGYIARNFGASTFLGSILDPLADKTLMTTLTVSLTAAGLVPGTTFDYKYLS
jgi:cardiolipin synthase